ncbi:MAG: hypothetical protein ACUVR2_02000, partial [Anaerolineae bacterium]
AQSAEQPPCKWSVGGSIPPSGSSSNDCLVNVLHIVPGSVMRSAAHVCAEIDIVLKKLGSRHELIYAWAGSEVDKRG